MADIGIIAFDPGETTGICVARVSTTGKGVISMSAEELQVIAPINDTLDVYTRYLSQSKMLKDQIYSFLARCQYFGIEPNVVIEDFILQPGKVLAKRDALAPVMIISILTEYLTLLRDNGVEVALQPPATKSQIHDLRLKRSRTWRPGIPHARDATRHALAYARRRGCTRVLAPRSSPPPPFWPD